MGTARHSVMLWTRRVTRNQIDSLRGTTPMNIARILTGSDDPSNLTAKRWLPEFKVYENHLGVRRAYVVLMEAGLVPPPSLGERLVRRFACQPCHGTGSTTDAYGERPCPYCNERSSDDILLPTTLEALVTWATLGRDTIDEIERQASSFMSFARSHGWKSAEGMPRVFSRGVYGPPAVTWKFRNMVRLVDKLPEGPVEEAVRFLSQRDQVCHNVMRGPVSCQVNGTWVNTVVEPIRAIWNTGVIPVSLDPQGLELWVPCTR
mgnify:CR=1 FL=1